MRGRGKSNAAGTIDGYRLANLILVREPNAPFASSPGLELHHPIMSMLRRMETGYIDRDNHYI